MADLIIKPATGTGNKLIVKDMAGGAVLTTADSGATMANATLTAPIIDQIKLTPTDTEPANVKGALYYDDSEGLLKHYDGNRWAGVNTPSQGVGSGGTVTTPGLYTVHTFTGNGFIMIARAMAIR